MGNSHPSSHIPHESSHGGNLNSNMLRHRGGKVFAKYEIIKTIGEGSMGSISKARVKEGMSGGSAYKADDNGICCGCFGFLNSSQHKASPLSVTDRRAEVFYALKTIVLGRVSPEFIDELRNEIDIMKGLDHPNIVKAYEVFEKYDEIYIVMELCSGGDLYKRLPYSEKDAANIVSMICSAIAYMHGKGIVHRDLKFENIMFENDDPDSVIKILDFGLSKKFLPSDTNATMTEGVGTIYTMAPQVLQGVYTSKADLWSVGVLTFMLLASQKPFYHKQRRKVIDKIMRCDYKFSGAVWEQISFEAKDFVKNLLVLDPKVRMDANAALKHKWLLDECKLSDKRPSEELMRRVEDNLLAYKETSALKKVALNVIAHKSSTAEIFSLREVFAQYDTERNGIISFEEFKNALKESNYSDKDLESMFASIDVNDNGHIVYTEFLAATLDAKGHIEEERIAEAFDRLDSDDSGYISREDLLGILGEGYTDDQVKALIDEVDIDKDGQISFEEFKTIFHKQKNVFAEKALREPSCARDETDHSLMGLDAKIPGGKYDVREDSVKV